MSFGVLLPIFFFISIAGALFLWVLRYHFRRFSLANDTEGRWVVKTYQIGYGVLVVTGLVLSLILVF